jgi:hypothetical protein
MAKDAANALPFCAGLPSVPPEDVRRAHEPVVVSLVDLDASAGGENPRAADEGDVVKVDDVEAT